MTWNGGMTAGVVDNMGFPGPLTPVIWQYTTTSLPSACTATVSYAAQLQVTECTNTFYAAPLQQHALATSNPTALPQTQVCASLRLPNIDLFFCLLLSRGDLFSRTHTLSLTQTHTHTHTRTHTQDIMGSGYSGMSPAFCFFASWVSFFEKEETL
jgi:hypothetical protein